MRNVYKINEVNKHRFYQVPKELFESDFYSNLSSDAKLLYGMLLDRLQLSKKNNWVNENNEIYLIFTRKTAQDLLNISKKTATKVFNELKEKELIFEERQGLNKPNLIYIGKIDYKKAKNPVNSGRGKNYTSGSVKSTPQEVEKLHTNDTELNDTNLIDTEIKSKRDENKKEPSHRFPFSFNQAIKKLKPAGYAKDNVEYYLRKYKEVMGENHPNLKIDQWRKIFDSIIFAEDRRVGEAEEVLGKLFEAIVDKHFKTEYKNCDYNILHFNSGRIMMNRYYEVRD